MEHSDIPAPFVGIYPPEFTLSIAEGADSSNLFC
jgi:hypothetical protein